MDKHLVLVGGGHAHLTVLKNIGDFIGKGNRATLISPSPYHYYSGMGPGLLSGIYRPQQARFHIRKMMLDRGASFVPGTVVRVDPERCRLSLDSGDEIDYDVVSFNTGSYVPTTGIDASEINVFPVKPIDNLLKARNAILERLKAETLRLLVIGGGPAGLELAGNLWRLVRDSGGSARIALLAGRKFLSGCPEKIRRFAIQSLAARKIELVEGNRVNRLSGHRALLEGGRAFPTDYTFLAWGIEPSPLFRKSGIPTTEDGGLPVNEYLQSIKYPEIFGGGDCISFQKKPLDKVGVYPVRENPILSQNLLAAVTGEEMVPFNPQEKYLLIFNLGDGKAIFWKNERAFYGRLFFYLKDYIDRKFMKNFQVSGELTEA